MTYNDAELHLFCTTCGAKLDDGAMFCQTCGAPQNNTDNEPVTATAPVSAPDRDHLHVHVHTHEPASGFPAQKSKKPKIDNDMMKIMIPIVSSVAVIAIVFGILGITGNLSFSRNNQNYANRSTSSYDRNTDENSLSGRSTQSAEIKQPQVDDSFQQQGTGQQPMQDAASNPASQGNDASQKMSINDTVAPETAAPAQPLSPQTTDAPYNSQRVLVWNSRNGWMLEFEQWEGGKWVQKMQTAAFIGKNGTSANTREGDHKTPEGTFNILFCYGVTEINTNLRFRKISRCDVFVDDADSAYYNTIVDSAYISAGTSHEKTYNQFSSGQYTTCIFFDFNGDGEGAYTSTGGRGSVRTLRGRTGKLQETLGDIDIASGDMATLLAYLDSAKHPIIIIG